jgi:23S rRNA (cytosine1962-C5)-methyltransferase
MYLLEKIPRRGPLFRRDHPRSPKVCAYRNKLAAARGYKDINLLAFKLLHQGEAFTFSCSGGVDAVLFQKIVASARWTQKWMQLSCEPWQRGSPG